MWAQRLLLAVAAGLVALIVGLALFWKPEPPGRPSPGAAGDFTLQAASGPISLNDYRDKLVLLYFGYTYCPDVCPTSLVGIAEGLKQLRPDELSRVATIFVSVDPRRDTPARLKEYAEFFHPAMIGATGTPDAIAGLARRYGAFFAEQKVATAGEGYVVDHSADTYVIGPAGQLLGKIAHATPPAQVAAAIRQHLNPSRSATP